MRHFKSHSFFTLIRRDSVNIATEFAHLIPAMGRELPWFDEIWMTAILKQVSKRNLFKNNSQEQTFAG